MLRDDTERVNQQVSDILPARFTDITNAFTGKNRFQTSFRDGHFTSKTEPSDSKAAKSSQRQGFKVEL